MSNNGVWGITFANSNEYVKRYVSSINGYISPFEIPNGLGVPDGLLWLANNSFFGIDSNQIRTSLTTTFPELS